MPKEVRSRRFPDRPAEIMSDNTYKRLVELGLAGRFIVKEIEPIKQIIILPGLLNPEIKKIKNEGRRKKSTK